MLGSAQALTLAPPVVLSKQGEALVAEADITEATIADQIDLGLTRQPRVVPSGQSALAQQ